MSLIYVDDILVVSKDTSIDINYLAMIYVSKEGNTPPPPTRPITWCQYQEGSKYEQ